MSWYGLLWAHSTGGRRARRVIGPAPLSRWLKGHLAGELNDPRIVGVCRARNFSVGGISERSRREGKLRCVEHVKGLRAELQLEPFCQVEDLEQGEIDPLQARAIDLIAMFIPNRPRGLCLEC